MGNKAIVSTMKAEEKLRASIAEASYLALLESLKHKECVIDDDGLDLTIIGNRHRDYHVPPDQASNLGAKNKKDQKEHKGKRKKK
jgi:hypothetical protein